MPAPGDLIHQTSSTTGTGNLTVGAVNGKRTFNEEYGTGGTDVFDYYVSNRDAAEWERGTGHLSSSTVLVRDTIKASSNAGAAVSFSAGTKDITNDVPAARQVRTDESNNIANSVASINGGQIAGLKNAIINGAMMVAQRGTSFTSVTAPANSDDTYLLDRWILLSDGNDVVDVTQATEAPTNGLYSIGLDVETVDKKFGIFQPIEQKNCIGLIGNTVVLSAYLKVTNATRLDKIKMAIVAWDGTADAITSDIISTWNADGTNPTLVANWTYENTPADLGVTTSWARYSVSAAVDTASTKNIGVFIWSDNVTDTDLGDFLHITDVQLEIGSTASTFERRGFGTELLLSQRYYEQGGDPTGQTGGFGIATSTTRLMTGNRFGVPKRSTATVVVTSNSTDNTVVAPGIETVEVNSIANDAYGISFIDSAGGVGSTFTIARPYMYSYRASAEL